MALDTLPDEFKRHARDYIDGTKEIGNLVQQMKNIKRDGLPSTMTRVAFEHIVLTYVLNEFDDAAVMYTHASLAVRKRTYTFFDGLCANRNP